MKILQLCSYFLPHKGGIESLVYNLSKQLVARGDDVTVITSTIGSSIRQETMDGITIKRVPAKAILKSPLAPGLLLKLIKEKPDVIHVHHPHPFFLETGILYAKLMRIPIVMHCHGAEITMKGFPNIFAKLYNNTALRLDMWLSDKIIVHSNTLVQGSKLLKKNVAKVNIFYIGVDEDHFIRKKNTNNNKYLRKELGIEKNNVVLYVGQLRDYKRVDMLIDAFREVISKIQAAKLIIVGKGEMENELKRQADSLGLKDKIIFTGFVSDEKLPEYYSIADVFVLPSPTIAEGFGIVALEAMAMDVPAIVTKGAGIGEAFTNDKLGVVIEPYSIDEMSHAIIDIIENNYKAKKIIKGFRKDIKKYSWKEIVDEYLKLYKEVMPSSKL